MRQDVWPSGRVKFYAQVRKLADVVTTGSMLCIDPASGSTSQAGWAFYRAGELVDSGVLQVNKKLAIGPRLVQTVTQLNQLQERIFGLGIDSVDVLVLELIRGRMAHAYLHWAVGVAIMAVPHKNLVECPIVCWKAAIASDPDYSKNDEADARAMGTALVRLACGLDPLGRSLTDVGLERPKRKSAARTRGVRSADSLGTRAVVRPKRRRSKTTNKTRSQRQPKKRNRT